MKVVETVLLHKGKQHGFDSSRMEDTMKKLLTTLVLALVLVLTGCGPVPRLANEPASKQVTTTTKAPAQSEHEANLGENEACEDSKAEAGEVEDEDEPNDEDRSCAEK